MAEPENPDPTQDPDPLDQPPTKGGRPYTQRDLNSQLTIEHRKGETIGAKKFAEAHGFASAEEMETAVKEWKAGDAARETEVERRQREAEAEQQKAANAVRDALAEKRTASLERALVRRGVSEDDLEDAVSLVERGLAEDADSDAISEAADALKERRPELFGTAAPGQRPAPVPLPAGGRTRQQPQPAQEFGSRGAERARRRGWIKDPA